MSGSGAVRSGQLIPLALVVALVAADVSSGNRAGTAVGIVPGDRSGLPVRLAAPGWRRRRPFFVQLLAARRAHRPRPDMGGVVRIAVGIALVAFGPFWSATPPRHQAAEWLNRLSRMTPVGAAAVGLGLIL